MTDSTASRKVATEKLMADTMEDAVSPLVATEIKIGGSQGHIEETISGDLLILWLAPFCNWKPIRNCTGRYSCREKGRSQIRRQQDQQEITEGIVPSMLSPLELMDHAMMVQANDSKNQQHDRLHQLTVQEFDPAPGRCDRILVLPLDSQQKTGIITYVKQIDAIVDETNSQQRSSQPSRYCRYVHTLNAPSGFQRKLHAVGIHLS
jgi:hypothetical protein